MFKRFTVILVVIAVVTVFIVPVASAQSITIEAASTTESLAVSGKTAPDTMFLNPCGIIGRLFGLCNQQTSPIVISPATPEPDTNLIPVDPNWEPPSETIPFDPQDLCNSDGHCPFPGAGFN